MKKPFTQGLWWGLYLGGSFYSHSSSSDAGMMFSIAPHSLSSRVGTMSVTWSPTSPLKYVTDARSTW